jgi:dTDP-4-amino-4,6-dideoxygalactose transaminase
MIDTPFTPWPNFTEEEASAVSRVLLSNRVNYWTGNECRQFEKEFSDWAKCDYSIALANGTVALDLALHVLGIRPGDDVVVAPRTYIASVSCAVNAGARPVFADVDRNSQNITAETIRAVLTPRTKAIICVHLAGMPCEMDAIMALALEKKLYVIEDCAQAHGALYKGKSVGTIGDLGAWSFCQDKIMTTGGEGGMLTTNRREWWKKAWSFKDHGKSWDAVYQQPHPPGFRWVHDTFGTNWRMTEMQAVIGRIQLRRMPDWHSTRSRNAEEIRKAAQPLAGLRVPDIPDHIVHAWYKYYMFIQHDQLKTDWNRDRILEEINRKGVPCYSGICPEVYLEKAFENTDFRPLERLAEAKELGEASMMFLVHPTLTSEEIRKTCDVIQAVMNMAVAK